MPDIAKDLAASPGALQAGRAALNAGAAILCDGRMTAEGIIRARLPAGNAIICTLDDTALPALAARLGNSRSAAELRLSRNGSLRSGKYISSSCLAKETTGRSTV